MTIPTDAQAEVLKAIHERRFVRSGDRYGIFERENAPIRTVNARTVARVMLNGWVPVVGPWALTSAGHTALAEYEQRLATANLEQ